MQIFIMYCDFEDANLQHSFAESRECSSYIVMLKYWLTVLTYRKQITFIFYCDDTNFQHWFTGNKESLSSCVILRYQFRILIYRKQKIFIFYCDAKDTTIQYWFAGSREYLSSIVKLKISLYNTDLPTQRMSKFYYDAEDTNVQNWFTGNRICLPSIMMLQITIYYYSVGKYPSFFFFLRKPSGFQWSALTWCDLEPSYVHVNFLPSVNNVSWWYQESKESDKPQDSRFSPKKSLNQVRCSSRSVIFLTMKIRREH